MKTKLFITERVPEVPVISLIHFQEGTHEAGHTLFTNVLPRTFALAAHEFVETLGEADYALFPHTIRSKKDPLLAVVRHARETAEAAGRRLIVFVGGDLSHDIFIDGVIVVKGSQYRFLKRPGEIIALPPTEDFADTMPIEPRRKSDKPVVSFCGWAGFATPRAYLKYVVKNAWLEMKAILLHTPYLRTFKKGLWFRRRAMRVLARDLRIVTRFIVRKTFSANTKTISLDPKIAREEYLANMRDSDFVLAPKGDGNFSVRFYEALSMGRIPILIDTETVLPFEDFIRYDDFILRVPYTEIDRLGDIVFDFHKNLSEEKFIAMQKAARTAYERHFRYDAFFNTLFGRVLTPTSVPGSATGA